MKLTVGIGNKDGFALPTILLVSTVMIALLVASVAAAAASRVSLDSQYYNLLAKQAAQSGIARAKECLNTSGYKPQWSTLAASRDLRPNSDCTGATLSGGGVSPYVVGDGSGPTSNIRTRYSIEAPSGSGIGSILEVVGITELVRTSSPNSVWRTYRQSLYHRIEAPKGATCPENFVAVPGDSRFNTKDFCISKYEAKNVGGKATSQASGLPYTSISQTAAAAAAAAVCSACHLVTQNEWVTIMHNAMGVASNWSGNSVGNGYIYSGHNDNNPSNALAASTDDDDGYYDTNNSSGSQRRTLRLSNGETVWDMAGNVWEWTAGTVSGGQPGKPGYDWRDWNTGGMNAGTFSPNSFPSFGTPDASGWTASSNGIGRLYSSSSEGGLRGIERGSYWNGGSNAGITTLNFNDSPSAANSAIGFRVALQQLTETTCSAGFVPVPGNSTFGTNNFCIAKYEAKNVGGVATSQAAGVPWNLISQPDAITAANNACARCRLITDAEWLTVAYDIANNDSNWTGGIVGSGRLYRGHSDNSPSTRLAASSNDADGYIYTGNSGDDQRRTFTLSNGQVVWDIAGNAWDLTSNQIAGGDQPGSSGYTWREWKDVTDNGTLTPDPFPASFIPAASGWTSASQAIGGLYSDSSESGTRSLRRGGDHNNGVWEGVFALSLVAPPSELRNDTGFRMVEDIN